MQLRPPDNKKAPALTKHRSQVIFPKAFQKVNPNWAEAAHSKLAMHIAFLRLAGLCDVREIKPLLKALVSLLFDRGCVAETEWTNIMRLLEGAADAHAH